MARKDQQAIDSVLETLFHLHVGGSVDERVEQAALQRLQRIFSKLGGANGTIEKTHDRLKVYYNFKERPSTEQHRILRLAHEEHISIEEACRRSSRSES